METQGSVKKAAAAAGAGRADVWNVPYRKIRIASGFNVRSDTPAYREHVQHLTASISTNGYDRTRPMAGYVAKEDGEDVFYVTDGHTRHRAFGEAIKLNPELTEDTLIPMVVHPNGTNLEDLTFALVTSNSGKPLEPIEVAEVIKRLLAFGKDEKTVAQRLGYTVPYVKQLLSLLSAPKAVRDLVKSGTVSATTAAAAVKKHGSKASEVLTTAAAAHGRVTNKHLKPPKHQKTLEAVAEWAQLRQFAEHERTMIASLVAHITGLPTSDVEPYLP